MVSNGRFINSAQEKYIKKPPDPGWEVLGKIDLFYRCLVQDYAGWMGLVASAGIELKRAPVIISGIGPPGQACRVMKRIENQGLHVAHLVPVADFNGHFVLLLQGKRVAVHMQDMAGFLKIMTGHGQNPGPGHAV